MFFERLLVALVLLLANLVPADAQTPGSNAPFATNTPYVQQPLHTQVLTRPFPCNLINRSFTTTASVAVVVAPANPDRVSFSFQVPAAVTTGVWITAVPGLIAGPGSSGSMFIPANTLWLTLDGSTLGSGQITMYTTTGSQYFPAWEC